MAKENQYGSIVFRCGACGVEETILPLGILDGAVSFSRIRRIGYRRYGSILCQECFSLVESKANRAGVTAEQIEAEAAIRGIIADTERTRNGE